LAKTGICKLGAFRRVLLLSLEVPSVSLKSFAVFFDGQRSFFMNRQTKLPKLLETLALDLTLSCIRNA
jgi:hypothetical protein